MVHLHAPLKYTFLLVPVDVLAEPAQINRLPPDLGLVNIEIAVFQCMVDQENTVNKAGFAGTVGSVDQRQWANRNPLNLSEGFETPKFDSDQGDANAPEESVALAFADGYRAVAVSAGDDEILAEIAKGKVKGDLEVEFWKDHYELQGKLKQCLQRHVGVKEADYAAFNRSLGIDAKDYAKSEAWQSPSAWTRRTLCSRTSNSSRPSGSSRRTELA